MGIKVAKDKARVFLSSSSSINIASAKYPDAGHSGIPDSGSTLISLTKYNPPKAVRELPLLAPQLLAEQERRLVGGRNQVTLL